jgi:hypothetical protein
MAVFQGTPMVAAPTRTPLSALVAARVRARDEATAEESQSRRRGSLPVVLVAIVAMTLFGLVYLTQVLHTASYNFQVETLSIEREGLARELRSQRGTIAQAGAESQIVQWAQQQGLDPLGSTLRVRAR